MTIGKARVWLTIPLALLAIAMVRGADLAQSQSPPARRIDAWSGLIVRCKTDPRLALPDNLCRDIVARVAALAAAGKVKLVTLTAADGPGSETAKAKALGFDDALAIEMTIDIHGNGTAAAALEVDARSRQHIMPSRPGEPTQYARIFAQSATFARDAAPSKAETSQQPAWRLAIAPAAQQFVAMFFDLYLAPPHVVKN
jgi:hypothetical protein